MFAALKNIKRRFMSVLFSPVPSPSNNKQSNSGETTSEATRESTREPPNKKLKIDTQKIPEESLTEIKTIKQSRWGPELTTLMEIETITKWGPELTTLTEIKTNKKWGPELTLNSDSSKPDSKTDLSKAAKTDLSEIKKTKKSRWGPELTSKRKFVIQHVGSSAAYFTDEMIDRATNSILANQTLEKNKSMIPLQIPIPKTLSPSMDEKYPNPNTTKIQVPIINPNVDMKHKKSIQSESSSSPILSKPSKSENLILMTIALEIDGKATTFSRIMDFASTPTSILCRDVVVWLDLLVGGVLNKTNHGPWDAYDILSDSRSSKHIRKNLPPSMCDPLGKFVSLCTETDSPTSINPSKEFFIQRILHHFMYELQAGNRYFNYIIALSDAETKFTETITETKEESKIVNKSKKPQIVASKIVTPKSVISKATTKESETPETTLGWNSAAIIQMHPWQTLDLIQLEEMYRQDKTREMARSIQEYSQIGSNLKSDSKASTPNQQKKKRTKLVCLERQLETACQLGMISGRNLSLAIGYVCKHEEKVLQDYFKLMRSSQILKTSDAKSVDEFLCLINTHWGVNLFSEIMLSTGFSIWGNDARGIKQKMIESVTDCVWLPKFSKRHQAVWKKAQNCTRVFFDQFYPSK